MDNLFENWRRHVYEADGEYVQEVYESYWLLRIKKKIGPDQTETASEIRAIPNVTTVHIDTMLREDPDIIRALYKVKFIIVGNISVRNYLTRILKPGIERIEGIHIEALRGVSKL